MYITCAVYSTFLNASTNTVSYAIRDQNIFKGEKRQNRVIKILLITGIICNFISIHEKTLDLQNIKIFLEFGAT